MKKVKQEKRMINEQEKALLLLLRKAKLAYKQLKRG